MKSSQKPFLLSYLLLGTAFFMTNNMIKAQNDSLETRTNGENVLYFTNPPCPPGKDTTVLICPFKGYAPDLLHLFELPLHGIWEPPLRLSEGAGYYNSCDDSSSVYIYTHSIPECPVVQDTIQFQLKWTPPCGWAYDACYTPNHFEITIPAYKGFSENQFQVSFYSAVADPDFQWMICGDWTINPDSIQTLICNSQWNNSDFQNICIDVRLSDSVTGCEWYFPPFDFNYEYWDCEVPKCEIIGIEPLTTIEYIKVFPVPAEDVLNIELEYPIKEVSVLAADGCIHKRILNPIDNRIEISDLTPGWYMLMISDGSRYYRASLVK